MQKNIVKIGFVLLLYVGFTAKGQMGPADVGKVISIDKLEHPYLLFTSKSKQDLLRQIDTHEELSEIFSRQLLLAQRNLKLPIKKDVTLQLERPRIYDKGETHILMTQYMDAALNLAFAYQFTGNEAYALKSFEYAEMLCKLDSWVYSFHKFNNIYSRVWPWNVDDDQVVFSYDLQSARTATKMALVYDWLYPVLEKGQRDRLRGALLENAITRVRGNYEYHWWANAYRCNWSGICHSGLGLSALALLKEDPHLMDVVAVSYNGVESMLNEIGDDGGWQEGRGYWAYALGHSQWFMEAIKNVSGDKLNLFNHKQIKTNPLDFALYTMESNFGDGRSGPVGSSWFVNKMIAETNNATAAYYRDKYIKSEESIFDLIWTQAPVKGVEPKVKSKHFSSIDWAVLQSAFDTDTSFSIVCKAGQNDDPHHGHLDNGQFIITYKGNAYIKDHGHPSYDDYYFSAPRWEYILASAKGHNVVLVNGEDQITAKPKDQPWKENIGGRITAFSTSDSMDYVSMELGKAYPGKELKFWQRQIILVKPNVAFVLDNVGAEKGAQIQSRIHPGGEVNLHQGYYTIDNEGEKVALVPVLNQDYEMVRGRNGSLPVKDDARFKWIPYVDVVARANSENTLMGMLVFPLKDTDHPDRVVQSIRFNDSDKNKLELSFQLGAKKFSYAFALEGKEKRLVLIK